MMKSHNFKKSRSFFLLSALLVLMLIGAIWSLTYGAVNMTYQTIVEAIFFFDPSNEQHILVREVRLPRVIAAVVIGSFLAVSGAIMQGITGNPLASPTVLGVSDGAAFAIAMTLAFMPNTSYVGLILFGFCGAGIAVFFVFSVGLLSGKGLKPIHLVLAGTAVGALFKSLSTGIAHMFDLQQAVSFWFAGGLVGVKWSSLLLLLPIGAVAFIAAMSLARQMTILNLNDEAAVSLGQEVVKVKILSLVIVLVLTGSAVSIAGNIGFIGLVIPHMSRFLIGHDYMKIIPVSAVMGGTLLIFADTVSRYVQPPYETPVGAITALIGVPFFLYLARKVGNI